MKTKTFDCVEMKHRAQQRLRQEMEKMTDEERREYYGRAHEQLMRLQAERRQKLAESAAA